MVPRERRSNGHPKPSSGSHDRDGGLPPDWEERYPRNGGGEPYYYNFKTHESTWVRPRIADSGPSSPAKERGQDIRSGVDRSPRRGTVDGDVHELRNEDKKHVSPGVPLRFEDRHYRPDGLALANSSSTSNNKQDSYARPAGLPPRPSSPRTVDKRRGPRSITPPPARRDARTSELAARSRRDIPPLVERDLSTRERRSPVQDREWDRSRNVVTLEDRGRGYSAELGTPRGRRLRDDPPSEHVRSDQGARDAYNPKSAPSTLSASYLSAIHRIPACLLLLRWILCS
ncbi:uncharacterized protein PHACADRAFT_92920 [Phanerochaete carnosa HHB-10118-sp]|uniref:WW domain-containing protein n=1 Tax=Phanerochaete carnosa (strain HHB-10118-sp) TaxID=650164 RepID=K5WB26_PHACS|nr:uncharacterized protein PHACADRAFT_92920 [Phanerochaete carnosa HHB-10118-sp]EKM56400.1 hypothetical protein PHACADRAFT_92920 [Phanerochaete carnosa HHB-10118-sp]